MTTKECTNYIFKQINPEKFMSLSYVEINSLSEFRYYMEKNDVVFYEGKYYMYKGGKTYLSTEHTSQILVQKGKTTVHKIEY